MCPLCHDAKEMNIDHIQKCQSLTDAIDNVSNGRDGGDYQNNIGLQEGKWETSLLLSWDKKMHQRQHGRTVSYMSDLLL